MLYGSICCLLRVYYTYTTELKEQKRNRETGWKGEIETDKN